MVVEKRATREVVAKKRAIGEVVEGDWGFKESGGGVRV